MVCCRSGSEQRSTYVGRPGSVAARGANFALQNSDLLLAIGVRLDFAITGYAPQNLARGAHKVVVDIDAAELRKLQPYLQQPIHADAKDFLSELLAQKRLDSACQIELHGTTAAPTGRLVIRWSQKSIASPRASFSIPSCRGNRH